LLLLLQGLYAGARDPSWRADSWQQVQQHKSGEITVLWCDIEPFIYLRKDSLTGVEYELMQAFPTFLKEQYGVSVKINWVRMPAFERIYPTIKASKQKGLFALSYFSITEERKKEVRFAPPYMPDLNVIVTGNDVPVYEKDIDFIHNLGKMKGYTMRQSTMEEDMKKLLHYSPQTPLTVLPDDYAVMNQIAEYRNAFGYVPLSIYIVALQRGVKVKRQKVLTARREGLAAVYTQSSDWTEPVNAYFNSEACHALTERLVRKHLGQEVARIIVEVSAPDSIRNAASDIELLTKEREIVAERFINSALQVQQERFFRNITIAAAVVLLIISLILLNRFRTKRKFSRLLQQRNDLILKQKQEIEVMNDKLQQKLILSQLNPHLIFNSLTAIQHFVMLDDKKTANKYLVQLSRFIRQILQNAEEPMILIDKERLMLEQYLALEQARFDFSFDYHIDMPNGTGQGKIPSMLIFPFVEQALYKRVLRSKMPDIRKTLHISFEHIDNTYTVSIVDNVMLEENELKDELTDEQPAKLAEEQIDMLNKYRDHKIILKKTKHNAGSGHEVRITIPDNLSI
jgi:hypothetical protein